MSEIKITGGVRIGMLHASWPLAKLTVNQTSLELKAMVLGSYRFSSDEVLAIRAFTWIPIAAQGIRIYHTNSNYSSKVIFWTIKNPNALLKEIQSTGFLDQAAGLSHKELQVAVNSEKSTAVFPIKLPYGIAFIGGWILLNMSFLIGVPKQLSVILALGFSSIVAFSLLFFPGLRDHVFKKGYPAESIKGVLLLVGIISAVMLLSRVAISYS